MVGTDAEGPSEQDDLLAAARLSTDATSAVLLAKLRQRLFAADDLPTVGRYRLEREIGSGGMGVVYAAQDPKLGRNVAIKLMKPQRSEGTSESDARAMLLREARAMAALSHPNVLPIYDVGIDGGNVFLAMELVDGGTLRQWLAAQSRSLREIVSTFTAAARGLQAAHAASLVHRDFKPSNVLVSDDGRVFVTDFGLARSVATSSAEPSIRDPSGGRTSSGVATVTGAVVGSPAYMSPQQHRGERPDPKADQWSFCVALYEAVYGSLPFPGDTLETLRAAVDRGLGPLPKGFVPANVRRVIRTGLRRDPRQRFADMAELRQGLQPTRRRRARAWIAAAAIGVAAAGLYVAQSSRAGGCDDAFAFGRSVWNQERRVALTTHAAATEPPWEPRVLERTEAAIDTYHAQWVGQQAEVCPFLGYGDAAEEVSARLRGACLRTRLSALREALGVLIELDGRAAVRAPSTIARLPRVAECLAIERLADAQRPGDPSDTPAADSIAQSLQRARALRSAGRFAEGLSVAQGALAGAEALAATRLRVVLLELIGSLQGDLARFKESAKTLEEAVFAAEVAHLDREAVEAAIAALFTSARAAQPDEAERWAGFAEAKLEAVEDDGTLRSDLLVRLSDAADMRGDYPAAARFATEAESMARGVRSGYGYAFTLLAVARAHQRARRLNEAEHTLRRALRIVENASGPDHPEVLKIRGSIAAVGLDLGKNEMARDEIEATLPRLRLIFGERSQPVALALGNLSSAHRGLGDPTEALRLSREALSIRREVLGDGQRVALNLYNVAAQLSELGELEEAIATYTDSLEMWAAAAGPTHPMLLHPIEGLAEALLLAQRYDEADAQLEHAARVHQASNTPEAQRVLFTFYRAQVVTARGDTQRGAKLATEARSMMQRSNVPPHRVKAVTETIDSWLREHAEGHPSP